MWNQGLSRHGDKVLGDIAKFAVGVCERLARIRGRRLFGLVLERITAE